MLKGRHKPDAAEGYGPEEMREKLFQGSRCHWINITSGRRCLMVGVRSREGIVGGTERADGSVKGPPMYCAFHVEAANGRHRADLEDLWTWVEEYREIFPTTLYGISPWHRYDVDTIREALLGAERCPEHPIEPPRFERRASKEQFRAAFARIHDRESHQQTTRAPASAPSEPGEGG